MSPEMFSNSDSEKCDIWSLGVVLYVLVTAQFPFDGQSDQTIMQNIQKSKFTTESKLHITKLGRLIAVPH